MLIKLPLNALSAISCHQIDARYPSHYGKWSCWGTWRVAQREENCALPCEGSSTCSSPSHSRPKTPAEPADTGQASKCFQKAGITQVSHLACALFCHCHIATKNELGWIFISFRASPTHQSSESPRNISCTHWQIVPMSEHGAILFWEPCCTGCWSGCCSYHAIVKNLWFPWEINDPWRKETREEPLIPPKFRCPFPTWWNEFITNVIMTERFGDKPDEEEIRLMSVMIFTGFWWNSLIGWGNSGNTMWWQL